LSHATPLVPCPERRCAGAPTGSVHVGLIGSEALPTSAGLVKRAA
jgi:hypothetical protein